MGFIRVLTQAICMTAKDRFEDLLLISGLPARAKQVFTQSVGLAAASKSPWLANKLMSERTTDGAILFGEAPDAGAKFALPKGLPQAGQKVLAIENEPHLVDGFSGTITEGYGKGTKTLLADEIIVLKIGKKSVISRMNYHIHEADVAGLHYDLVIKDLPEGTEQFEINIPRGDYKGRYSFVTTNKGIIVVPMKDRSVVLPKPDYKLKPEEFLSTIDPKDYITERKYDGSLGNAVIGEHRAYFRSHRDSGNAYTDKLPALEFLDNKSPFAALRAFDPGAKLNGTVLKGELIHQDGVSRVSGILNSHPERAQAIQGIRGPVKYVAWDIQRYKGRNVSHKTALERRRLLDNVISEIRRYNKNWDVVEKYDGSDLIGFYQSVISDPRGLPYAEGIVLKKADATNESYIKVKARDFEDFIVVDMLSSGIGTKYADSAAVLVVQDPISGRVGEVGSFAIPDAERQWIWDHREELRGAVAKILVVEKTSGGAPRAGVFHGWHGDPRFGGAGTEMSLQMYAETLAGGDPEESKRMIYRLKSAAGWKR